MELGDEILARAREAAARTHPVPATPAELEALRVESMEHLALLPEPPAYKRGTEPARDQARSRLPAAEALLERALLFVKSAEGSKLAAQGQAIAGALEAQVRALAAVSQGQIIPGEELTARAQEQARAVGELASAFHRVRVDMGLPVYDRKTGTSRFDPHALESLEVNLPCPAPGCRTPGLFALSTRSSTHRFVCAKCRKPFVGDFGEVRSVESKRDAKAVHYTLQLEPVGGGTRRVEFDDASGGALPVAPRDLVALLYGVGQTLAAVENLSSGRILWVKPRAACFLATAAYGPGAPELDAFRAFRDRELMPRPAGRLLVRVYYAVGPHLAAPVARVPPLRRMVRAGLERLRPRIEKTQ